MRLVPVLLTVSLVAGVGACSKSEPGPAPASNVDAKEATTPDSTSLSIDTDKGSVSYDAESGDNKTSISIGEDKKDQ